MPFKRTQVYLEPEQHRLLKKEAEAKGISLAELLRQLAREHLRREIAHKDFFTIVGLGESGKSDGSEEHDRYIAESVSRDESFH